MPKVSRKPVYKTLVQLPPLVEITADELQGQFEDWEDCIVRIGDRFEATMKHQPLQLEAPDRGL
jgi:hypothetical protein